MTGGSKRGLKSGGLRFAFAPHSPGALIRTLRPRPHPCGARRVVDSDAPPRVLSPAGHVAFAPVHATYMPSVAFLSKTATSLRRFSAVAPYLRPARCFIHDSHFMLRFRRLLLDLLTTALVLVASFASWVQWGGWPDPEQAPVFADADALVILGGGDFARFRHGAEVALEHPALPLVVTGDKGLIVRYLVDQGIPLERILHEDSATSTVENAKFTKPMLDEIGAKRVILVTNGFHAPRSLAIFRKYQPDREFVVSFPPRPEPPSKWDRHAERRERLAAVRNLVMHGVWSW